MNSSKLHDRKTMAEQQRIQQQKDAKHCMYVLDEWLKTEITYKEDIQASLQVVKRSILKEELLQERKCNRMFPQFESMLGLSKNMIEIISKYKGVPLSKVMIGKQINQVASYYKIYLEYFKRKTEMKAIYDEISKDHEKDLREIEEELKKYFAKIYKDKDQNPKANITILDCLQRPLYRLFKYHLLIDSYLKKLPQSHIDHPELMKARQTFIQIGQKCNNSFTEQQRQDLKRKLELLYGRTLPQTSQYKMVMTADTLYFPCKLYVFNNLIIVSKAEKTIGYRQEKLYMNLGIDEFSFVVEKKDVKYFKNILLLGGIYECIHLYLPDKGTRYEIYQIVSRIIETQKLKAFQKRQHNQEIKANNKINFLIDKVQKKRKPFLSGFRMEVIDIDIRNLGYFSNDTAFILSMSIPEYIDDEATYLKNLKGNGNNSNRQSEAPNKHESEKSLFADSSFCAGFRQSKEKRKEQQQQNSDTTSSRGSLTNEEKIMASKLQTIAFKDVQSHTSDFMKSGSYNTLRQYRELHLEDLIELHRELKQLFPEIRLPEIDPLSKDFNFYTESKKKTKQFEVRTFLIEEFFNFIIRHPSIMENPIIILKKLRIEENLWSYIVERTTYINSEDRDQNEKSNNNSNRESGPKTTMGNKYDQSHCHLCRKSQISSMGQFQELRQSNNRLSESKSPSTIIKEKYCVNSYNLMRNNLLGLNLECFNTLERMLLYCQSFEGRLDYKLIYRRKIVDTEVKRINVFIPKVRSLSSRSNEELSKEDRPHDNFYEEVCIYPDHKTTVGMVLDDLSEMTQIDDMLDYRLVLEFNELERILDQDEYVHQIIAKYDLDFTEYQDGKSSSDAKNTHSYPNREVYSVVRTPEEEAYLMNSQKEHVMGWMSKIKSQFTEIVKTKKPVIYLKKLIYLPLYLEIDSARRNFARSEMAIAQVFSRISSCNMALPLQNWGQICGLYYCMVKIDTLVKESGTKGPNSEKQIFKYCMDILPREKFEIVKNKIFRQKMINTIEHTKKQLQQRMSRSSIKSRDSSKSKKDPLEPHQDSVHLLSEVHCHLLTLSYNLFKANTLYFQVTARQVPHEIILDDKLTLTGECFIGVNHNEIIVVRDKRNPIETIRMPLEDVEVVHSVYSVFLRYKRESTLKNQDGELLEQLELRFDSKMLYGFVELCGKYKTLKDRFGRSQQIENTVV